ncbi:MAG: hypothetical protein CM1200mP30_14640 [Pseudomonadota bacterium]|nr:MAG: hypothetical protein CM1200mP30_14640 [Pseudomonadota bacterium]
MGSVIFITCSDSPLLRADYAEIILEMTARCVRSINALLQGTISLRRTIRSFMEQRFVVLPKNLLVLTSKKDSPVISS